VITCAATLDLAFLLSQKCTGSGVYAMVIFGVFDMLAYLYVANPLTEIFTLLLFFCMADLVSILMASGGDVGLDTPRDIERDLF